MIIMIITTGKYKHMALVPFYCIISYDPRNCPGGKYHCADVQMGEPISESLSASPNPHSWSVAEAVWL